MSNIVYLKKLVSVIDCHRIDAHDRFQRFHYGVKLAQFALIGDYDLQLQPKIKP